MKIDERAIDIKEIAGETEDGKKVMYVKTLGGLHAFFVKGPGTLDAIGVAPHKAIAKFFSEKKEPNIKWLDSLKKSADFQYPKTEEELFSMLRDFVFSKQGRITHSPSDVFLVYDSVDSSMQLLGKSELLESKDVDGYAFVRDISGFYPTSLFKDLKDDL